MMGTMSIGTTLIGRTLGLGITPNWNNIDWDNMHTTMSNITNMTTKEMSDYMLHGMHCILTLSMYSCTVKSDKNIGYKFSGQRTQIDQPKLSIECFCF